MVDLSISHDEGVSGGEYVGLWKHKDAEINFFGWLHLVRVSNQYLFS